MQCLAMYLNQTISIEHDNVGGQVLYMLPIYNIHEMDIALNACYALEIGIRC